MTKRSLHVGNNYPGTPAELAGCVNDAYDWAELAGRLGYETRVTEEAQHDEIVADIAAGLSGLKRGDTFLFTFSGHGSWVPDADGDEADGRDEVLIPADYHRAVLTDDTLYTLFQTAPGVRRIIASDSCHSGSVHRFVARPQGKARYLPPSMFLSKQAARRAVKLEPAPLNPSRPGAVLLSGCADTEFSYDAEFGGRPNGTFTYYALQTATPAASIGKWHGRIRTRLPNDDYSQTPQLQAKAHQRRWTL